MENLSAELELIVPAFANGEPGRLSIDQGGNAYYLIDCSGEVKIKTDRDSFITHRKGTGHAFGGGESFKRLEIVNYGAETTIRLWVGNGRYIDRRFELLESQTRANGWDGPQQVAAMSHIDFVPKSGSGYLRRKSVIVTNLDANENLIIADTEGFTLITVFARSSVTLPVSDTVRIKNETGAAIPFNFGEINYVEGNLITAAS